MTVYAIFNTSTNEVVGGYEDELNEELDTRYDSIEAPAEFEIDKFFLWVHDSGSIVKKTGSEFKEAYLPIKKKLIQKHFNGFDPVETSGDVEGAVDVAVQMLHHFVNSTTPTQTEIDNWNAFYNTNKDYFRYAITSALPQALWDAMGAAKAAARSKEQDLKNDPDWEDPS